MHQSKDEIIQQLIDDVSEERIRRTLFALARDPLPRRTLNYTLPGHDRCTLYEADDLIAAELQQCGYAVEREPCRVQAYRCNRDKPLHHWYDSPAPDDPYYTAYNLYANKQGSRYPNEFIVLIAHKDSQSWIACPGANDNAIGTASIMELARVLAGYNSERSMRWLFCNEEHSPWTSEVAAAGSKARGEKLIGVFNLDGVGVKSDEDTANHRLVNISLYSTPEGKILADLMAEMNEVYQLGLEQRAEAKTYINDDDGSYIKAGFPHVTANIGSWPYADPQYHLEGDVPERTDTRNACLSARATLAAVLTLDRR